MTKSFVKEVLNEYVEERMPELGDPMPGIMRKMQSRQHVAATTMGIGVKRSLVPRGIKAGVFAGVPIALAIIALAVFMWPSTQARPASAAEILAKVEGVSKGTVSVPLQSAHLISKSRWQDLGNKEDGDFYGLGTFTEKTTETWYKSPGNIALGEIYTLADGTKGRSSSLTTPEGRYLMNPPGVASITDVSKESSQPFSPLDLTAVAAETSLGSLDDVYTVTVVGTNNVLGRPVYVLQKDWKEKPYTWSPMYKMELWIDQEYFVVLKTRMWLKDGGSYLEQDVTKLEFNVPVADSLLEVPTGTFVADMRSATAEEVKTAWRKVNSKAGIALYAPVAGEADIFECGPITLYQGTPTYNVTSGVVSQALTRHVGQRGVLLHAVVAQGKPSVMSKALEEAKLGEAKATMKVGSVEGHIYKGGPDKPEALIYDMGSMRIVIYYWSNESDTAESIQSALTDVASRLQLVTARK